MVENPHHLEVSIAHINHCLDERVDVAKNELHILTMDCSINGSLLFLFRDDGVCQEAAEMPRDIICFSCIEQARWSPC